MKLQRFEIIDIKTGRVTELRAKSRRILDRRLGAKRISKVLIDQVKE